MQKKTKQRQNLKREKNEQSYNKRNGQSLLKGNERLK